MNNNMFCELMMEGDVATSLRLMNESCKRGEDLHEFNIWQNNSTLSTYSELELLLWCRSEQDKTSGELKTL